MINKELMVAFIPTFLMVSITPGMCMTLAMTLGITIGVRHTLWMMAGELLGVALVATAAVLGVATLMLNYPTLFSLGKYLGGGYLLYLSYQMWHARGKLALTDTGSAAVSIQPATLALQGFITAIANPKGWAFFIALLPPFIDPKLPMAGQLSLLVLLILLIEFACLLGYAGGGQRLRRFLQQGGKVRWLNRLAASLMAIVGLWLALG